VTRYGDWIQTFSGNKFYPLDPREEEISLVDIAWSLSMQGRFSGHTSRFYSIAQHSVLVSYLCDPEYALQGLLHDASEAYLVDIPTPVKRDPKMAAYREFETNLMGMVYRKEGLSTVEHPSVKRADKLIFVTEAHNLMRPLNPDWDMSEYGFGPLPGTLNCWPQPVAFTRFMDRYFELKFPDVYASRPRLYHINLECLIAS